MSGFSTSAKVPSPALKTQRTQYCESDPSSADDKDNQRTPPRASLLVTRTNLPGASAWFGIFSAGETAELRGLQAGDSSALDSESDPPIFSASATTSSQIACNRKIVGLSPRVLLSMVRSKPSSSSETSGRKSANGFTAACASALRASSSV